ncbi:thymidylate synthase [Opitutus terrae]|uniref:Thymidylate synthase-like protein n=1 Tax=Opitutus terrae (strain DSM 11246 / JCM 15787 / PB90-1) TaxID=452637 RepID=B1ZRC5_OPITP|nr:thymidylate synthase [Opitutus terrae]ACB74612.1 Thymidylate synthase-like protein [Opitutus terrae PB90-1]
MKNIPVLHVCEQSLAAAYEKALVALHEQGVRFRTQYDKPGDPQSLDCTMNLTVLDPLAEPMIHKAFPGGIEELREYVMEVSGAKDHWVKNMNDPKDTRWEYTYHGRLAAYGTWQESRDGQPVRVGGFNVNQIEAVIAKLVKQPFTRQAQMITWMPNIDLECYDPPCLQSLWYRLMEDDDGVSWLNCNVRFRSNDAWGASFMNMFGFVIFNRDVIAAEIARRTGKTIKLGRLNWQADSYHIYGKDIAEAKARLFDRIPRGPLADRTYEFSDEGIQEMYNDAEAAVRAKIAEYDATH